jgi:hypothetical protein
MKTISTLFLAFFSLSLIAQDSPYEFSILSESYAELENPTILTDSSGWDDPSFIAPIGFGFDYFGSSIITLNADNNFLGGMLYSDPSLEGLANLFVVYASDLIDIGYNEGVSESTISYELTGNAPTRVFKMQWKNCGFYNEVVDLELSGNRVNFQLWLYETTNDIEIRFGSHSIKNSELCHDGDPGPWAGALVDQLSFFNNDVNAIWSPDGYTDGAQLTYYSSVDSIMESPALSGNPNPGTIFHYDTGIVNVNEQEAKVLNQVYPTSFDNSFFINAGRSGQYELYSLSGQLVDQGRLNFGMNTIAPNALHNGLYLVKIRQGDQITTNKLIKQ